jgi:hypothetical protein
LNDVTLTGHADVLVHHVGRWRQQVREGFDEPSCCASTECPHIAGSGR